MLPLTPCADNSPYNPCASSAGNPLLISPDVLKEDGLLDEDDLQDVPSFPEDQVDYARMKAWKMRVLQKAWENFRYRAATLQKRQFQVYCEGNGNSWLEDYALFMSLQDAHQGQPWIYWPSTLRKREPNALKAYPRSSGGPEMW